MLDQNKAGRYLKYALGEIILVMIGILLALQVNTWNQDRILKKVELQLLKSLHKEFSNNFRLFEKHFEVQLNKKEAIETVMSIEPASFSMNNLRSIISSVNYVPSFDPSQGIYNSVINSGKIELISHDSLKERISGFQDLLIDYREDEDYVKVFATQNLHKVILSEMTYDNYDVQINNAKVSKAEEQRIKDKYVKLITSHRYVSNYFLKRMDAYSFARRQYF